MPEVCTQGRVLALVLKRHLVLRLLGRVLHALCHCGCHLSPIATVLFLVVADRGAAFAVGGRVVEFAGGAMREANLVLSGQATMHLVHWKCKFDFSHVLVKF